jgi:hypothetical protein
VADDSREWVADLVRALQTQQASTLARLERAERDIQDHDREMIAGRALDAREHREMRDEYLKEFREIKESILSAVESSKLRDLGLRNWLIGALIATLTALMAFIATNLGKFINVSAPR